MRQGFVIFWLLFNYCFSKRIERIKRRIKGSLATTVIRLIRSLFFIELNSCILWKFLS